MCKAVSPRTFFFLAAAAVAYSVALQVRPYCVLAMIVHFIVLHFFCSGVIVATVLWYIANNYLRTPSFHGVEQRMEWKYAFDIHCNSFFPLFLLLYVLHYFFLPFLVQSSSLATILGNALYATALCYYLYITSLGYSALPFLEHTELFLYPSGIVLITMLILCLLRVNLTLVSLSFILA